MQLFWNHDGQIRISWRLTFPKRPRCPEFHWWKALKRIFPNHASMTAAAYDAYHLIEGNGEEITAVWPRTNGW